MSQTGTGKTDGHCLLKQSLNNHNEKLAVWCHQGTEQTNLRRGTKDEAIEVYAWLAAQPHEELFENLWLKNQDKWPVHDFWQSPWGWCVQSCRAASNRLWARTGSLKLWHREIRHGNSSLGCSRHETEGGLFCSAQTHPLKPNTLPPSHHLLLFL